MFNDNILQKQLNLTTNPICKTQETKKNKIKQNNNHKMWAATVSWSCETTVAFAQSRTFI